MAPAVVSDRFDKEAVQVYFGDWDGWHGLLWDGWEVADGKPFPFEEEVVLAAKSPAAGTLVMFVRDGQLFKAQLQPGARQVWEPKPTTWIQVALDTTTGIEMRRLAGARIYSLIMANTSPADMIDPSIPQGLAAQMRVVAGERSLEEQKLLLRQLEAIPHGEMLGKPALDALRESIAEKEKAEAERQAGQAEKAETARRDLLQALEELKQELERPQNPAGVPTPPASPVTVGTECGHKECEPTPEDRAALEQMEREIGAVLQKYGSKLERVAVGSGHHCPNPGHHESFAQMHDWLEGVLGFIEAQGLTPMPAAEFLNMLKTIIGSGVIATMPNAPQMERVSVPPTDDEIAMMNDLAGRPIFKGKVTAN